MLHPRVEAPDWSAIGEDDRQLQLCVPLVDINGDSCRLRDYDNLRRANRTGLP